MAKVEPVQQEFNVGVVDKDKLHLNRLARVQLAAEVQTNWIGTVPGAMIMRPGFEYLDGVDGNNAARLHAYYRSEDERALFELTEEKLRIWIEDEVLTRPAVTSTVTNGDFVSGSGGWTVSGGAALNTAGTGLTITGETANGSGRGILAIAKQQVSTSTPDLEHALRIDIGVGPVSLRVGSTDGGDEYVLETKLDAGVHSIAFTPSGDYWVQFAAQTDTNSFLQVKSVAVEAAGVVELTTPWAEEDLRLLRFDVSLDVTYVACDGYQQHKIERRGQRSWSVAKYVVSDGPFGAVAPMDTSITVDSAQQLSTGRSFISAADVGGLVKVFAQTKRLDAMLGADSVYTDTIRVTGVKGTDYNDRNFKVVVSGTWAGTLRTYRSFDAEDSGYRPFRRATGAATIDITANGTFNNDDDDDNSIAWYKVGFDESGHTSGIARVQITYDGDAGANVYRISDVISATEFSVQPIDLVNINTGIRSTDWVVSDWPIMTGWPLCGAFFDGRLFWGGRDKLWGSISDAFNSFDDEFEGEAGPINRAIAVGGSNVAYWMLALDELLIGTSTSVIVARASTQGERLTPDDTTLKPVPGSVACSPISPVKLGNDGFFVDGTGKSLRLLRWNGSSYAAAEISRLTTEIFGSGIVELADQTSPDPRIWAVTGDGKLVCVTYDAANEVLGFYLCETDGEVESVTVQRGKDQDRVYAVVKRTVNGADVRCVEKMAQDVETAPGTLCKVMDSFLVVSPVGTLVSGLDHLEGRTIVAWAKGAPILNQDGTRWETMVSSGQISLPAGFENTEAVVGLPYRARYKSGRLGNGVEGYSPTMKRKRLIDLGLLMTDFVRAGVKFGADFDTLDDMPVYDETGSAAPAIVLGDVRDEVPFPVDGAFGLDSRFCIEVSSPFTAKMLAIRMGIETV